METKINKASSAHDQIRTTIPTAIAERLELKSGDKIDWELDKIDGVWIAIIKKVE
jgi:bifunctional DNA-binding transcriptional regulator/antitoxin component of YhaV-PrlF toxin-antitoxin module